MKDCLGDRMKSYYEGISKYKLTRRTPVIIRVDGKAFHTFTRHFNKPFDCVFSTAMIKTMESLCRNIQGCVFGYTQSDEITLVLNDYKTLNTEAWFDYEVQKMCSVSASMATMFFNKCFVDAVHTVNYLNEQFHDDNEKLKILMKDYLVDDINKINKLLNAYSNIQNTAMFDSRCFNIPKEEVANCLIWRQQDATRNSIEMLGRYYFSPKQLHKKSCDDIQDMLMEKYNVNWNDMYTVFKRGACCYREVECDDGVNERKYWVFDDEIPIFTQDRNYIEKHIL